MRAASLATTALLALAAFPAGAQHDVQRNAVQKIALGNFDDVPKVLAGTKKPNAGEAETRFVEMLHLLAKHEPDAALVKAREALAAGLPLTRFAAGPRELLQSLPAMAELQGVALVHGPMVGSVTDEGASFWVRTRVPSKVTIVVGEQRASATTTRESDHTAVVRVTGLAPGASHDYQVRIDGKPVAVEAARFDTYPKAGQPTKVRVGIGGGAGFIPEREFMWDTIQAAKPSAFLMLGDNVYIDQPEHELCQHYCYSRRQSRPEWRRFTASTAIYSIWDDHDFGTNDCVPGAAVESPAWKRNVWRIFQQNWVNPSYGGGAEQPGCWYDFVLGDIHFFMLDGRYYRNRKGTSMLGPAQKAWLERALAASTGTFKVIASPVPFSPNIKPGSKDPWDGYAEERAEIFGWIRDRKIEGVVLVAADRHRTDLRTIPNDGAYTLYEFESSRLTNRHTHPVVKTDGLIWGYNAKCSFGLLTFDTTLSDPEVQFEAIDIDGVQQHSHTLKRSALRGDRW